MNTFLKYTLALGTAGAIALAAATPSEARGGRVAGAVAAGVVTGAVVGAAAASAYGPYGYGYGYAPGYYDGGPYAYDSGYYDDGYAAYGYEPAYTYRNTRAPHYANPSWRYQNSNGSSYTP